MLHQVVLLISTPAQVIPAHLLFGDMAARHRTPLDWLFIVFIAITLPVMVMLGYRAYQDLKDQVSTSSRVSQEIQIQELKHRIRSEQSRKCILDAIDALGQDELVPRPAECELDLAELTDDLERAEEDLID